MISSIIDNFTFPLYLLFDCLFTTKHR